MCEAHIYSGFLAASRWRFSSRSLKSIIAIFCAATYAWSKEIPLLAIETGNAITVRTLNKEMPRTEKIKRNSYNFLLIRTINWIKLENDPKNYINVVKVASKKP